MRLKLIFITTAVCVVLCEGLFALALYAAEHFAANRAVSPAMFALALLAPVAVTTLAARFIYRHTSRRRTAQGIITAVAIAIFTALPGWYYVSRYFSFSF